MYVHYLTIVLYMYCYDIINNGEKNKNLIIIIGIVLGPNARYFVFSRFQFNIKSRSLKYPLHIVSYALRIVVSVMEL